MYTQYAVLTIVSVHCMLAQAIKFIGMISSTGDSTMYT